jgi:uncharacterized protein (TIGR02246 family)
LAGALSRKRLTADEVRTMNDPGQQRRRWRYLLLIVVLAGLIGLAVMKRTWLTANYLDVERAAILQVLQGQADAWNRGDLDGFMDGYWHSDDLTYVSKSEAHGWEALRDHYRQDYQAEGREMGRLTFGDVQIDVLAPDAAWVRGRWKVTTTSKEVGGWFTLIFKKRPEGWRIVHDHTSALPDA